MKFLILASLKNDPPKFRKHRQATADAEKLISMWKEEALLDCAYQRLPEGGLAIASVDSGEKLWELIHQYPLYRLFEWHIEPLAELEAVLKGECAPATALPVSPIERR